MKTSQDLQIGLGHRLTQFGVLLLLLGLVGGFFIPAFANPRMGLTSHMEGVLNGMLLVVFGLLWPRLRLSTKAASAGFWLAIVGAYVNWATTLAAAVVGAGEKMMPLAAAGYRGSDLQEILIAVGLTVLSVSILSATVIVLWGLRRGPTEAA